MKKLIFLTLLFTTSLFASISVPPLQHPVTDEAQIMDPNTEIEVQNQIMALYNEGKGPQVAVLIVKTLSGHDVAEYAHFVFTTWKLGNAKRDDGILFLIAPSEKKMKIEVGQGLEGDLTDYDSKKIIRKVGPYFSRKDFSNGIKVGVEEIIHFVKPQPPTPISAAPNSNSVEEKKEVKPVPLSPEAQARMQLILFILVFGGIIVASIVFLIRSLTKWDKSKKDLFAALTEAKKVEEIHQTSIKNIPGLLEKNVQLLELNIQKCNEEISIEEHKRDKAPLTKLEKLREEVSSLENKIDYTKADIQNYRQMIKEGR